ncbi:hypothetical protein [Stutzerimonas xanthomarina]|uniref:hypothetical protein n=1 Tax=Stutzerimonas xanthomarina TaxID=271420 RepID=UPI003AA8AA5E
MSSARALAENVMAARGCIQCFVRTQQQGERRIAIPRVGRGGGAQRVTGHVLQGRAQAFGDLP